MTDFQNLRNTLMSLADAYRQSDDINVKRACGVLYALAGAMSGKEHEDVDDLKILFEIVSGYSAGALERIKGH